jgi:hypothetical protein
MDLEKHKDQIKKAFETLAAIKGVEYTGAAKILHLVNTRVFVMWDRFISGQYAKKHYLGLEIVRSGFWEVRKYPSSGQGYFAFLLFCQKNFGHLQSPSPRKTLAKCIDEFNYCKITEPIAANLKNKKLLSIEKYS